MKQQIIENNQIDILNMDNTLRKSLNMLKEKDQYYEKLLIFVVKLACHNFKSDILFSENKKSEIKHKNPRSIEVYISLKLGYSNKNK
jgi:hypothetical protein